MSEQSKEQRVYGPSLRPDDVVPSGGIGPALPEHLFKKKLAEDFEAKPEASGKFESLDTIGPLIPGQELREEWRHLKSETDNRSNDNNMTRTSQVRDAWMTELLPVSNDVNSLKARKFRQSIGPGADRRDNSWFKTPGSSDDVGQKHELEDKSSTKESLLEMHERKLAHKRKKEKKKEKKEKRKEKKHKKKHKRSPSPIELSRRPFDRDRDLKISRVDAAARRAIVERSKQLSSRFGHGNQQYL